MNTNTTTKKLTKRDRFNALLAIPSVAENADLVAFIEHEIELLSKKNGERKPTAKQEANADIKGIILDVMSNAPDHLFTISELMKSDDALGALSNQKISALMRQMVLAEEVERVEDKRKAFFRFNRG